MFKLAPKQPPHLFDFFVDGCEQRERLLGGASRGDVLPRPCPEPHEILNLTSPEGSFLTCLDLVAEVASKPCKAVAYLHIARMYDKSAEQRMTLLVLEGAYAAEYRAYTSEARIGPVALLWVDCMAQIHVGDRCEERMSRIGLLRLLLDEVLAHPLFDGGEAADLL